jgi:hypothetical protein
MGLRNAGWEAAAARFSTMSSDVHCAFKDLEFEIEGCPFLLRPIIPAGVSLFLFIDGKNVRLWRIASTRSAPAVCGQHLNEEEEVYFRAITPGRAESEAA